MARLCPVTKLCFSRSAAEISALATSIRADYESSLDAIVAPAPAARDADALYAATFGRLAAADNVVAARAAEATLPALVAAEPERRTAGAAAKALLADMYSAAYARRDVYEALSRARDATAAADGGGEATTKLALAAKYLSLWERNGLALPSAEDRAAVAARRAEIGSLAAAFEQAINEDAAAVAFTEAELAGVPPSFVQSLPLAPPAEGRGGGRSDEVRRLVGLKAPQMTPVLQTCRVPATRRALHGAGASKVPANVARLGRMVQLRREAAALLGHPSHAASALADKMAGLPGAGFGAGAGEGGEGGGPATVHAFLDGIAEKLRPALRADLLALAKLKREEEEEAGEGSEGSEGAALAPWDIAFFTARQKAGLGIDEEAIKRFFPAAHVVPAAVAMVAELLGLRARRVGGGGDDEEAAAAQPRAVAWHPSCETYEISTVAGEAAGEAAAVIGHVILDLYARPNKFGHQMVVPLRPALRERGGGEVQTPVCTVLGNLGDEARLLRFREVETLLHELGHVFHALCGAPGDAVNSWAWPIVPWPGGVEMDYLEVPSMLMQQLVYAPAALSRLSRHVDTGETLGAETVARLVGAKRLMAGYGGSRYIAMCKYDLALHGDSPPAAAAAAEEEEEEEGAPGSSALAQQWAELYKSRVCDPAGDAGGGGLPLLRGADAGTHFASSWYHMAIGYDAAYYGYLWSEVLALDAFSLFEKKGEQGGAAVADVVLDAGRGAALRAALLEPGARHDGGAMMRAFLGRAPSDAAYLRSIGIGDGLNSF